ncbi:MAG: bifunctional demethylmenaquinone methyltransferase/2-methoxy-6-polyprenyl-1,4-benzoquinol methylase UbiE [Chthoniobacterales bacterium]
MPAEYECARDPEAVRTMFGRIAQRYDVANHLLSGGIDFAWRRLAARTVRAWQPARVLDLATGSGDLAIAVARQLPAAEVTAADFSPEMLAIARAKGAARTVVADALKLPFADAAFDCVTIAFGLRNMVDWAAALRETARVLSHGGHLLILDFSVPNGALRPVYRLYLHHVLPRIAALLTGQKRAYDYLGASIEKFPSGDAMIELIEANGFRSASARSLTGGVAAMYVAQKSDAIG